jgi:thiamine biosynthesis lipoprotein
MNINKIVTVIYIFTAIAILQFSGCSGNISKVSRPLLGTVVTITISDDPEKTAGDFDDAFKEIESVQKTFSLYDPASEISVINKMASHHPVRVSDEIYTLIKRSLEVSERTEGAFDITFASAGKLWNFSQNNFTPPDDAVIKKLLPLISYKNVRLDENKTVRFLKSGTKIGLGGIAKGYATGKAISALRNRNVKGAIVACAGDIQVIGDNNGQPWRTGIQDPRGDAVIGAIDMMDGEAVSTSGDYERYRIINGRRYHHIINPATGYPAESGLISVSVFSSDPVLSDVYSTAFFISGLEKTQSILAAMNDVSAVLVTADMKVYVSMKLKEKIVFRNDLKIIYF